MSAVAGTTAPEPPAPSDGRPWASGAGVALALAAGLTALVSVPFLDVGLNLADEGFLWYGVERLLEGRVPVRDFQAYNPARYWWCAAFVQVCGPGILSIRLALAAFQLLGVFCGLRVLQRAVRGPVLLVVGALVLAFWMFPRHKLFESSLTMMATLVMLRLLEHPSARRHFLAGLFVGVAGLFGRNHLLYTGLGFLATWGYAWWRVERSAPLRRLGAAAAGGLVGLAPLFALMVFVPGFAAAFVESLAFFLSQPTNQALPYPWPWQLGHQHLATPERLGVAFAFLVPPLAFAAGLLAAARSRGAEVRRRAPLIAATLVGVFYVHHVAVRSDVWHLSQCLAPALLALFALPAAFAARSRAAGLVAGTLALTATVFAVPATNPAVSPLRLARSNPPLAKIGVAGDTLRLPANTAGYLERVKRAVGGRLDAGETLFVAPGNTTFYPLLGRRSPFRDVYFLWSAPDDTQREMARVLASGEVPWVLIVDEAVDGREDLLFRNTNPIVWRTLGEAYARVATPELPPNHLLLRWRD